MKLSFAFAILLTATAAHADSHAQPKVEEPEVVQAAPSEVEPPEPVLTKGVFGTYGELRVELDSLIMTRQITKLMLEFGAGDEMTEAELVDLEARVQQIYKQDFVSVDLLRRQQFENGWRQELLVYAVGLDFIYAYVLLNDRKDDIVSVNFRFNSDFQALNGLF